MPYPVLLSLIPSLFLSPFFLLTPVSRLNLSRHDPGYHLPCHTLSFFVILPLLLYILLVYLCLPAAVLHLSTVVGPINLSPSCSVDRPPSARHTLFYGASLFSAFPCPIASYVYKAITLCLHPFCPSVVSFRPPGCVCPSAFLLPRLVTCLHYVYIYQSDFDY